MASVASVTLKSQTGMSVASVASVALKSQTGMPVLPLGMARILSTLSMIGVFCSSEAGKTDCCFRTKSGEPIFVQQSSLFFIICYEYFIALFYPHSFTMSLKNKHLLDSRFRGNDAIMSFYCRPLRWGQAPAIHTSTNKFWVNSMFRSRAKITCIKARRPSRKMG